MLNQKYHLLMFFLQSKLPILLITDNENSQTGHYNDGDTPLIARPRLLDVIASVNNGIESSKGKAVAKNCRVTRIAAGGQHSLMVIKRYL